jgi:hypothetical protein
MSAEASVILVINKDLLSANSYGFHFDVPLLGSMGTPFKRVGSFFGPLGGLPPWNAPALASRDSRAQFAATWGLPPSLRPLIYTPLELD